MSAKAPSLRYVVLWLTTACNLRCAYCYRGDPPASTMPLEVARSALKLAAQSGLPFHVQMAGGEPTLEPGLMVLDAMTNQGYRVERRYAGGDEPANEKVQRMTFDRRGLNPDQMAARAEAIGDRALFMPCHKALPEDRWCPRAQAVHFEGQAQALGNR